MEITEKELMQIINEEVQEMIENGDIDEGILDRMKAGAAGLGSGLKSKVAGAFGKDTADIDTTQKLKQAVSLMKSYDKKLLKLAQSLKMDATKLGIEDQTGKVQQAINQTRQQVASIARDAPTSARMQRKDRERYGDAGYSSQTQQQSQQRTPSAPAATPAATPTAPAPAATPTAPAATPTAPAATPTAPAPAATPTASAPAAKPKRQLSQDPRNVRRREKRAAAKAAAEKERARKDRRNAQARARRAAKKASATPLSRAPGLPSGQQATAESKVKKGETLNEQLQEISRRWGFDK